MSNLEPLDGETYPATFPIDDYDATLDPTSAPSAPTGNDVASEPPATTGEPTPAAQHDYTVALAHESFKLRMEGAYKELETALNSAWIRYSEERGIAQEAPIPTSLTEVHHDSPNTDPTRSV